MPLTQFLTGATLDHNKRQGRFGTVYLRALAAQAGCTIKEPDADEDVDAIDAWIGVGVGYIPVQVKARRNVKMGNTGTISYPAEPHWIERWKALSGGLPIYFVVVVVPPDNIDWMDHSPTGTAMKSVAAYWTRVDPVALAGQAKPRITASKANRLSAATFTQWQADLLGMFR